MWSDIIIYGDIFFGIFRHQDGLIKPWFVFSKKKKKKKLWLLFILVLLFFISPDPVVCLLSIKSNLVKYSIGGVAGVRYGVIERAMHRAVIRFTLWISNIVHYFIKIFSHKIVS